MENLKSERERESPIYYQLLNAIQKMDSTQRDELGKHLNNKSSVQINNLFEQLCLNRTYLEALDSLEHTKKYNRECLGSLKKEIIKFGINPDRKALLNDLVEAESALKFGFDEDGLKMLEEIGNNLNPSDFWIKWRVLDLQYTFSNLKERSNFSHRDSLYSFTRHYINSSLVDEETENQYVKHSNFLAFLCTCREISKYEIPEFTQWYSNAMSFIENYSFLSSKYQDVLLLENGHKLDFLVIEYLNLVKETNAFILYGLRNQLFDFNNEVRDLTIKMVENLKSLSMNSFPFTPNSWPNALTFYFFQLDSELSIGLQVINSVSASSNLKESYYDPLNGVESISTRISILSFIGKIFAMDSAYSSDFSAKIESVGTHGEGIFNREKLRRMNKELDKLINISLKGELGDYCYKSMIAIRVLLYEIYGPENLKKDKACIKYRTELMKDSYYSRILNENKPIEPNDHSTYFDFAIIKLHSLAILKRKAQKEVLGL